MNSGDGPQGLMHRYLVPAETSPQLSGFAIKFPSSQRWLPNCLSRLPHYTPESPTPQNLRS